MKHSVLITGARGYLGGRLVTSLANDIDLSVTGTTRGIPQKPNGWPAACQLLYLDPLRQDELELAGTIKGADTIIHLAAPNEINSAHDPVEALIATAVASLKLLRAAERAGSTRFIYLSTIHIYGGALKGRIVETDLPKPIHPYAIAHRTAEDWILAAHAMRRIDGVVLRLSNGIGAPAWPTIDRWTLIGNDLCRQAIVEKRVALRSSGMQWRDFILMSDFASAIRHTLALSQSALGDGLFNLGGQLPLRMVDVAEIVARRATALLGQTIAVERQAPMPGEFYPPIDFVIDRFVTTGFSPSKRDALDAEIDATLALCLRSVDA